MQIDVFTADDEILAEIGLRLKAARVRAGVTQEQMAHESGVAKTTVERAEKGQSIQLLNLIKLLRALNALSGFEMLLPSAEKTPLEYIEKGTLPHRVRNRKVPSQKGFVWGDEQ